MIFVTVGTHEQQFDRLVREVDNLKRNGIISEEVIIQTGFSNYKPQSCESSGFFSYEQMVELVRNARIVITHGGPSSFVMPLQEGKIPIVVPRKKSFGEHVNDHQVEFCAEVAKRHRNIIMVENIDGLSSKITDYNSIVNGMGKLLSGNNARFCKMLDEIVDGLF